MAPRGRTVCRNTANDNKYDHFEWSLSDGEARERPVKGQARPCRERPKATEREK